MKLPSVMDHSFSRVPQARIERSRFDRSHGVKTTFDAGYLVPVFVDEALPGDSFNLRMSAFARLATPVKPVMDNLYLDSFFFAVPVRLLWDNWEKFNGAQTDPGDTTDYEIPQVTIPAGGPEIGSLSDYFGLPTDVAAGYTVSALWHRAYNLIWNTWFRDENLQDSLVVDKDDGPDTLSDYVVQKRGKRHDYFTSCLPWPQKGDAVTLPLGSVAPITGDSSQVDVIYSQTTGIAMKTRDTNNNLRDGGLSGSGGVGTFAIGATWDGFLDPNGKLKVASDTMAATLSADLGSATAVDINSVREAFQLQRLLEADARGGTRYIEILRAHFGVTSPDARLQRPEYLGGGSSPINVHPVPQQNATGATGTPQGNLAAFGTGSFQGHGFAKAFVEHCVLLGLVCVRADLTYQQGLERMWSRLTRYDYYWPALAHLGEQAVLNKEIYFQGTGADANVFGYQERYAEYRYKPSRITGEFRSSAAASLDVWHLSQEFGSLPTLGADFIKEDPPIDRVIAVTSEPHLLFDGYFRMTCARPMPVYGVPLLGDRL